MNAPLAYNILSAKEGMIVFRHCCNGIMTTEKAEHHLQIVEFCSGRFYILITPQ